MQDNQEIALDDLHRHIDIDRHSEDELPIGFEVPDWRPAHVPPREALEGRFCRVEPISADRHAESLFESNSLDTDGRMWTYLGVGPFASFEEYRGYVETCSRSDDPMFFAIVDIGIERGIDRSSVRTSEHPGRAVGVAAHLRIDPPNGSIEVGHLAFSPLLQRTPAATEAMYLMMKQAFDLGYRRYEWKCNALNKPSRAAAQRLGFSYEGVFRQATVVKGRNRDTAWYAIIDSEWPELDAAYRTWLDPSNFDESGRQRVRLSDLTAPVLKCSG